VSSLTEKQIQTCTANITTAKSPPNPWQVLSARRRGRLRSELWGRGYRGCAGAECEGESQRDSSPAGKSRGCWRLQLWM